MNTDEMVNAAFQEVWNRTLTATKEKIMPSTLPRGFVLGGQPGAGKSNLIKMAIEICQNNIIIICGDDYRKYHPDYEYFQKKYEKNAPKYTAEFAGNMTEAILNKAVAERYNIVIEGTFRKSDTPIKTLSLMKKNGYKTTVLIQTASKKMSWKSCQERYEKMLEVKSEEARWTDKAHHDTIVENLAKNIRAVYNSNMADKMEVYFRNEYNINKQIYTSESKNSPSVKKLNSYIGISTGIKRERETER